MESSKISNAYQWVSGKTTRKKVTAHGEKKFLSELIKACSWGNLSQFKRQKA